MLFDSRVRSIYWDKVVPEPNTGCWLWTGAANKRGYGNIMDKPKRFTWTAHRLFYTLLVGEIPPGLTIDHRCRNTCCVNPDHMDVVTLEENSRRQRQPRCAVSGRFITKRGG